MNAARKFLVALYTATCCVFTKKLFRWAVKHHRTVCGGGFIGDSIQSLHGGIGGNTVPAFEKKLNYGLSFNYDFWAFELPDQYRGQSVTASTQQPPLRHQGRLTIEGELVVASPLEIMELPKQQPAQKKSSYAAEQRLANGKIGSTNTPLNTYHPKFPKFCN